MGFIKFVWIIIAIFLMLSVIADVTTNLKYVESAMQASQLYNEATIYLLGIISFTSLLILISIPGANLGKGIQNQINHLSSDIQSICDELSEIKELIRNLPISNETPGKIDDNKNQNANS